MEKLETSENRAFIKLKPFFFSPTPQPVLHQPRTTLESNGYAKYHYSACQLTYVHRPDLEKKLANFVNGKDDFLWWTLIGEASIGKSRLILNYCEHLSEEWNWGWWTKGSNFDFSKWEPEQPTLIVLDYVMGRLEEIGQLFDTLISRKSNFIVPVRVLIAERLEDPWQPLLLSRQTTGSQIFETSFKKNNEGKVIPLRLKTFNTVEKLKLAQAIIKKVLGFKKSPEQLVQETEKLDSNCRPLFMWLVAEKLVSLESAPDLEVLLREHIEQQRVKRWEQAGVTDKDELYSTVTTICGGISLRPQNFLTQQARQWFSKIDKSQHAIIIGRECLDNLLLPFEPDILGELHALDILQGSSDLDVEKLKFALNISSGVDGGRGAIGFLFRAAGDFPKHQVFSRLGQMQLLPYWHGIIAQYLVLHLNQQGPNRSREAAWRIIDSLKIRMQNCVGNDQAHLQSSLAMCAVNISHGSSDQQDFKKIKSLEQEVQLFTFQKRDESLFVYHSQMLNNLLRANLDELMPEDDRIKMTKEWLRLAKNVNYPLSAKKQIVGLANLKFVNAINAQCRKMDDADNPESWYPILKDAVIFAADQEHSDIVYFNSLKSSYERLANNGQYDLASFYAKEFISYFERANNGTDGAYFGSVLFNQIQKLKNTGKGDPNAANLLRKLSKLDEHSSKLI